MLTDFWVKCMACAHCWVAVYGSVESGRRSITLAANSRRCPKCGGENIAVAKQESGVLLEVFEGTG
jgi:Zn finger protein HypA/HybF involved in hydrogenase expression